LPGPSASPPPPPTRAAVETAPLCRRSMLTGQTFWVHGFMFVCVQLSLLLAVWGAGSGRRTTCRLGRTCLWAPCGHDQAAATEDGVRMGRGR
jgi:hypothetical protein